MGDYDRRLVELYDDDNPDGPDHDFYRALADDVSARSVVDLGCGTGILTVTFASEGRAVVGVDPSANMLAYARARPGASAVDWRLGDSRNLPSRAFDYAVMTGNVVQHIPESDWSRTLRDLRAALRHGGTLAFESRNPAARSWQSWTTGERSARETASGTLIEWSEAEEIAPGVVELVSHNLFTGSDETITETLLLHFRGRVDLEHELTAAGFAVDAVYGDWDRGPVTDASAILVFVARAR
jgi:SAM-dependent methyltransferase